MAQHKERRFEIRQANAVLSALVASADSGLAEKSMAELAEMAGVSRVQAQMGLRILKERGRVLHERRGTRNRPGQFRILSETPVSDDDTETFDAGAVPQTRVVGGLTYETGGASELVGLSAGNRTLVALLAQENAALQREVAILRERLQLLGTRAETLEQMLEQALSTRGQRSALEGR